MVVLGYRVVGLQSSLELLECLEHVASLEIVEQEELVAVQRVGDEVDRWLTAELLDLQHLVIVVHAGKDRSLDEQLDSCAAKGPHVDALVIKGRSLTRSLVYLVASHEHFGCPIVARLDVRVDLVTVEGCVTEVDKLDVDSILGNEDVLRLQVTVNEIGALARD